MEYLWSCSSRASRCAHTLCVLAAAFLAPVSFQSQPTLCILHAKAKVEAIRIREQLHKSWTFSHGMFSLRWGHTLCQPSGAPGSPNTCPDTSLPSLGIGVASWSTSCPGAQAAQHMLRALRQPLPQLAFTSIFRLIPAVGFLPPPIWFNICSQNRELLCL